MTDVAAATAINADDVDQILGDLHSAKVNLMGISYGTAVEQVFSRGYPCAVCRGGPGLAPDGSAERARAASPCHLSPAERHGV